MISAGMVRIVRVDQIAFAVKDLQQAIAHAEGKYGAKLLSPRGLLAAAIIAATLGDKNG